MPVTPSVQNFLKAATSFGFSKKYNFQIESIDGLPQDLIFDNDFLLYAQSLRLPTRKINTIKVPYRTFEFVVPGNATYPDNLNWGVTFLSDNESLIRSVFEYWGKIIFDEQTQTSRDVNFSKSKIVFNLLNDVVDDSKDPNSRQVNLKRYTLWGAFPTLLDSIDYNISNDGTDVASFNVTFAYQYFTTETAANTVD